MGVTQSTWGFRKIFNGGCKNSIDNNYSTSHSFYGFIFNAVWHIIIFRGKKNFKSRGCSVRKRNKIRDVFTNYSIYCGGLRILGLTRSNYFIWLRQREKILIFFLVILRGLIIYLSKNILMFNKKIRGLLVKYGFLPIIIRPTLNLSSFKGGKVRFLRIDSGWAGHRTNLISNFLNYSRYSARKLSARLLIRLFLGIVLVLLI